MLHKINFFFIFCFALLVQKSNSQVSTQDTIIRIEASPKLGFNFPYYLSIPKNSNKDVRQFLLVETNNTGRLNDTLAVHDAEARLEVEKHSLGSSVSRKLKIPFLVPVFPRSQTQWKIYTHAFDRDAALIPEGEARRLDLQLIAMIEDAKIQLKKYGWQLQQKVFLNGFSASGSFANRFTLIHPNVVAGVACGGINAMAILPVKAIEKTKLEYPLGVADFEVLFGSKFDFDQYKTIPQYLYMGGKDTNDAALFEDAYSKKEKAIVFKSLGEKMADRWNFCKSVYEANNINATFVIYPNIGHQTDREVLNNVVAFFENIMAQQTAADRG